MRWRRGRGDVCSVIGCAVLEVNSALSREFMHVQTDLNTHTCTLTLPTPLKPLKGIVPYVAL